MPVAVVSISMVMAVAAAADTNSGLKCANNPSSLPVKAGCLGYLA